MMPPPKKIIHFCLKIYIEFLFLVIQGFALKRSILLIDFFGNLEIIDVFGTHRRMKSEN